MIVAETYKKENFMERSKAESNKTLSKEDEWEHQIQKGLDAIKKSRRLCEERRIKNTSLRIVSWNCHYGFYDEKLKAIKEFDADILVIPECREMDMEESGYDKEHRNWWGDHKEATDNSGNVNIKNDLGVGVFWKDGITVTQLPQWRETLSKNNDFRYLIPYKVEGNFELFTLIAVWTKNKMDAGDPLDYVQKAHAAVDHYKSIGLLDGRLVLIGDFNSNSIWDNRYRKECNHSALVEKLKQMEINDCSGSLEKYNTYFYSYNGKEYSVIDDYCFASAKMSESAKFSVPDSDKGIPENGTKRWRGLSDHCPIIVDFAF
jgi:exonuclease III